MKNSFRLGNERTQPMREEPRRRARPDPGHEPREVVAVRESHPSPLGEPLERAGEHEAGPSHEIALPQHEMGGEVVSGPAFEKCGSGRSEFVEEDAQLEALLGVEREVPHVRRSLPQGGKT